MNVSLIHALHEQAEQARRHELERALKLLRRGEAPARVLEGLSQGLTNKLMHAPTQALGEIAGDERRAPVDILTCHRRRLQISGIARNGARRRRSLTPGR